MSVPVRQAGGEARCDAVDGFGFLALALMRLQTGRGPGCMGFHF